MKKLNSFIDCLNVGDKDAWEKLYTDFYPALCVYAARLQKSDDGVEDIVQDCLINLWKSPPEFQDMKMLTGWLYRAVYTRTLNAIRGRGRAQKYLGNYSPELDLTEEVAIETAIEEDIICRVQDAVKQLSGQQQQVIILTLAGLKVREMAERMGISENTVKMQKKRAYAAMRDLLGDVWMLCFLFLLRDKFQ